MVPQNDKSKYESEIREALNDAIKKGYLTSEDLNDISKEFVNSENNINKQTNVNSNTNSDIFETEKEMPETKTDTETTAKTCKDPTKPINPFDREHIADTLWNASIKHPYITLGLIFGSLTIFSVKFSEHIIANGVKAGNMRTFNAIRRMTK